MGFQAHASCKDRQNHRASYRADRPRGVRKLDHPESHPLPPPKIAGKIMVGALRQFPKRAATSREISWSMNAVPALRPSERARGFEMLHRAGRWRSCDLAYRVPLI